jgi:hypothetical protein
MAQAEVGEFSLIVTEVDPNSLQEAARKFAEAFSLDETIAQQICKSAPIIFAQKLTKAEVKAITGTLTDLSSLGMDFRVTARVAGRLPKVNWPVRPQFTAGGSAAAPGLAFEWDHTAFVCPGCGETFLFRRLGKLQLSEPPAAPAPAAAPAAPTVHRTTVQEPPPQLQLAEEQSAPPQLEGVEGVQPLAGEGESLDLPESVEQVTLDAEAVEAPPEEVPAEEAAAVAEPEEQGEFSAAVEEAPAEEVPAEEAPAEEEAAEEEAAPPAGVDLYNVFLSKITDSSKRDKAAELIAKIKKCPTNEAKELTARLVIPLAKNVTKEKAEDILNQFKKLKIFGRMTKVK